MRDLKTIAFWLLVAVLGLALISSTHASAEENTTANITADGSYVVIESSRYPYHEPYRISQGQTVYVNDTIDIAGMGHGKLQLVWYGKYGEYYDPQYVYTTSQFKRDLINFWLDPGIFESRTGMWYQYYGNETERNGNLAAFRVSDKFRNVTKTYPNGTVSDTPIGDNTTAEEIKVIHEPPLPEKHITDYLVARGDPLVINSSRVWIFGRLDGIYAHGGYFTASEIGSLDIGSYKIVTHEPGRNAIFEVNYDPKNQMFTSPWKNVLDESVAGSQPMLDMNKFYARVQKTDDIIKTYDLEVQMPEIYVDRIDEVAVGSRVPVAYEPGMTLLDVRGYTNSENNTVVTTVLDPDKQTVRTISANTYTTKAGRLNPGSMSSYQVYIPINKNNMPNGIHTVKVSTSIGSVMYHDFPVSELPADSFVPNATLKYIGDRNPWVPTPTPEIITKVETKVVDRVVTVEVTPPQEMVDAAQKSAVASVVTESAIIVVKVVLVALLLYLGIRFAYRVWARSKWGKK